MTSTPDILITRDGELMVVHVEGVTDEAISFIDNYYPQGEYTVVDSGRMIFPEAEAEAFYASASKLGLTWSAA